MAKPTERALKRKPMAVVLLTTLRKDVPNVPDGAGGREFEWFETEDAMKAYFDQNVEFHKEDAKTHSDMAYLAVEITDTANMTMGRIDVQPSQKKTDAWLDAVQKDVTLIFQPVKATTSKEDDGSKKAVRPRRKSTAAAAVKKDGPADAKAARLKDRLAAKKDAPAEKKSETGDKGFVVKKAATASA